MAPSIPREVVKWIQGLAVTHTIKDAKFDLANGYLIAQLFQRYYPREVNLFAFENGQSIHCRSNNWEMLFRMFKKVKFPTTREEFEEICHHVDDAAVLFLCKVYEFLTGKKVRRPHGFALMDPHACCFERSNTIDTSILY